MKRVYHIFKVFLKIFFRDRVNLFFTLFFNAFIMIFFGLSMADRYNIKVNIGISDLKNDVTSKSIIHRIQEQSNVEYKMYQNKNEMLKDLKNAQLIAGVIINDSGNVTLIGDKGREMWLQFMEPELRLAIVESTLNQNKIDLKTELKTEFIEGNNIRYIDFFFPALLLFSIMQTALSGGIMLLAQRKSESLKRLQITPLKKWEFLLGYISSYLFIMIIQVVIYIILAKAIFGFNFYGNSIAIIALILLTSIMFIALGITLSNFLDTVENGNNFNRFFIFPASLLCGVFIPLDTLPMYLQKLAYFHPLTYLVMMIRNIGYNEDSLMDDLPKFILLLGLSSVLTFFAIYSFKWQEKTA